MAGIPSIGDIMLLSSLAWKIGTAFTSGRAGAPAEFREVENELDSLKKSITMLADTLDTDDSLLGRADDKTKEGLTKILDCCQETLENLESLVNNYQEIRKPTGGGGVSQRSWKSSFLRNYKKVYWTSEGGNIQGLRNMLQMHVSSISLTMKALQSKSLARLESTIEPMAEKVDGIHDHIIGNIDVKIAEMHSLMMAMASPGNSPWITPSSRQGTDISIAETLNAGTHSSPDLRKPIRSPAQAEEEEEEDEELENVVVTKSANRDYLPEPLSPRPSRRRASSDLEEASSGLQGLGISSIKDAGSTLQTPELNGSEFSPGSSPEMQTSRDTRWSDLIPAHPYNLPSSPSTMNNTKADSGSNRWSAVSDELPTVNHPDPFDSPRLIGARRPSSQYGHQTNLTPVALGSPVTVDTRNGSSRDGYGDAPRPSQNPSHSQSSLGSSFSNPVYHPSRRPSSPLLPSNLSPSNLSPYTTGESTQFTRFAPPTTSDRPVFPRSAPVTSLETPTLRSEFISQPTADYGSRPWLSPKMDDDSGLISSSERYEEAEASRKNPCSPVQFEHFKQSIFGDAAILCEAIGASVEYTVPNEEKPGDWKMIEATKECQISVVTKRFKLPNTDKTRYISSIWTLSYDRKVRLQQRLLDDEEIIPYTVWGNTTKIVLRVPTELKYHGFTTLDKPIEIVKTEWVNYIFDTENGANEFQNALMGKRLLYSLCTRRTLRTHENIVTNTFTFQEQLCGLENLRLWTDDEGDGSVLGMIQYSANFRDGYLAFRLGGPYTTVQVRDDGEKWVKIKGLNVSFDSPVDKKAMKRRKSSAAGTASKKEKGDKRITGVRIEFVTMGDKHRFMEQFKTTKSGKFLGMGSP